MTKYKCFYTDEAGETQKGDMLAIEAETPEDAAEKFVRSSNTLCSHVCVCWGFGKKQTITVEEFLKQQDLGDEDRAAHYLEMLSEELGTQTATGSYFELSSDFRLAMSDYLKEIIEKFENRGLGPNEVKFIHAWLNVKDRNLGESLLAKRVASLPPAERGNSKFANLMLLGMMASTMRLENALEDMQEEIESVGDDVAEMEEDVGDMNEGFGFEE